MRTRTAIVVFVAVVASSCSGSQTVAEVNDHPITAEQVTALSAEGEDEPVYSAALFRRNLTLLIFNTAFRTAAESEFGIEGLNDADRLADRIANPPPEQVAIFANIAANPDTTSGLLDTAAEFFLIRDAVLAQLIPDQLSRDPALISEAWDDWSVTAMEAAEVAVASQIGVWDGPGSRILPPPSG
ncbi:MAG: hypothetical protein BMS9Abin07_0969 [Acidimicrobiia bacterium]|nr:MAG: hypothetical protein BMS9Abin07_0969 [Acidimicrobiia bacterium]